MRVYEVAKMVELVVLDVDGVLTDGSIVVGGDGSEMKFFNVKDGHGIKLLQRAGIDIMFVSGRYSEPTLRRAEELGVKRVFIGVKDKLTVFDDIVQSGQVAPKAICYIGDDLVDIPVMRRVGFPVAVSDAVEEVKKVALYVTKASGGHGAVREVSEIILKSKGKWEELLKRYYL